MGCWNGTCGLTNLPILAGEEVYVFPILDVERKGKQYDLCYATGFFKPLLVPFVGKYNDYGAVEDCNGMALEPILHVIRKTLVEKEVGENPYHDIAVKRDAFDIDLFFEAIHEQRLSVKEWGEECPVYFTMIRKDVVDRLWNEWKFDIWKPKDAEIPEGFETDQYYVKNVTYAKIAELIPSFVDAIAAKESFGLTFSFDRVDGHLLSRFMGNSGYRYWDPLMLVHLVKEHADHGEKECAAEWLRLHMIGMMIDSFMENIRAVWLPVTHQGSQSQCYDEYRLLNTIKNDVISNEEDAYEEEYDEHEDLFSINKIYLNKNGVING